MVRTSASQPHKRVRDMQPAVGGSKRVISSGSRASHSKHRYTTLTTGFATVINRYRTETLVIEEDNDRENLGDLATQNNAIYVALDASDQPALRGRRLDFRSRRPQ